MVKIKELHFRTVMVGLFVLTSLCSKAQEAIVVGFEKDNSDLTAQQRNVKDLNGSMCALLRVLFVDNSVKLEGDIVKREEPVNNEYKLWMIEGATMIDISSENSLPITVKFEDYDKDIKELKGGCVYVLKIAIPEKKSKSYFYIEPGVQIGGYSGYGASVGAYIYGVNIEAQMLVGMSACDPVYWYNANYDNKGDAAYKANRLAVRAGYGIKIGRHFSVTPQVGMGILMISKSSGSCNDNDKTNATSLLISARAAFNINSHIQIAVAPEYSAAINKGKVFEQLAPMSSKAKGWADGFNIRAGIAVCF